MNKQKSDILRSLMKEPYINQRILAELSGHSLGAVNRSVRELIEEGYLDKEVRLTDKARDEFREKAPKRAVILAAGFGMRMVPINMETPKALLEVNGERLIERTIQQLHETGIEEIYVVVGFMKEKFEYLIDSYGVELIVNPDYITKNNLHSVRLALEHLSNCYIIPCDIWCERNPYRRYELYSWYMVSDLVDNESGVRVNRKMELVRVGDSMGGNAMVGISYILEEDAVAVRARIEELCGSSRYDNAFWEEALYQGDRMIIGARVLHSSEIMEINTYEQLRELDGSSNHLQSDAISVIADVFETTPDKVTDIAVLKKGMTNRSFLFSCKGEKYIMRIPGEGTDKLINRVNEAEVYRTIAGKGICDDPVYINPQNGYKITAFLDGIRVCNPLDVQDLEKCMAKLRSFHAMKLTVGHEFNIFQQIEFYESLWQQPSIYKDYCATKENVLSLKPYIDEHVSEKVLTHIDAVPDNFLFYGEERNEKLQLTDWEYAAMNDPHVDIAMFCIYALYDRPQVDRLISIYFENNCPDDVRIKIYCYIAACGLLWSNWCEYKRSLGVEFGEYSLRQYRFAKDYYRIAADEIKNGL